MEVLSSLENLQFESKLPYITISLVTLIALFAGYFKLKFSPLSGKKLPPGTLGFPFIGESISFLRAQKEDKTNEWFRTRINKYGPVFKTSIMGSKAVIITGQAGNRFMFSGGDTGISSNQLGSVARILGKHSIFEISGPRHKLVRGAIMSFLKPESIQRYVGEMDSLVQQQLNQELNGKDCIIVKKLIKKITFKVTCSLLFGLPEGKVKDALFKDFKTALKGMWVIPLDFRGTAFRKALEARVRISAMLSDLVKRRREQLMEEEEGEAGSCNDDVISVFIKMRDENGEPLSEEEMIDDFVTLIFGSHDTSTVVLCFLIRHLARDAEIFDKVLQEQKEVIKAKEGNGGKITWNEIQMMKYTWRVTQELMRMTPPLVGNFRSAWRDTNFGGFDIPKGWQVFWISSGTQMDKNIFEEPEKFDPSRFDNSLKSSIPPYTYIPFGAGPRICPGAEFARVELLLIIHHLITNYGWTEMIPNEPITRKPMPYPVMGLPIKLHPRKPE